MSKAHLSIPGALILFCAWGITVHAAFPMVMRHQPLGMVRGTEATLTFFGERLGDATSAICDMPGIEVVEVKPVDDKSVTVKLKTAPEIAPGLYPIRLVTASGIANIRLVSVGAMPIVQEVEPNSSFESPQKISMNCTVEGVIDNEDVDHYSVELAAGQKLTVEIEGVRLRYSLNNQSIIDPFIAILDSQRFELAVSDDSSLLRQDGLCTYTPTEAGTYTILVRDSSFLGHRDFGGYRLHVGSYPRPITINPSAGTGGDILRASVIDVDGTVSDMTLQMPTELPSNKRHPVVMQTEAGIAPSPNWVRVDNLPIVIDAEPNDDLKNGQPCQVPATLCGVIAKPKDYDYFKFEAKKGERYRIELIAREVLRSPLDGVIHLFDPAFKTLSGADDIGGKPDSSMDVAIQTDGPHTLRVYDHLQLGSERHNYVLVVSKLEPALSLSFKELRQDEAMVVSVPQGGYGAAVVQVARDQFNEQVEVAIDGLPSGVTATTYPIPKGRTEIPILFHAASDGSLGGHFFSPRATSKLGDRVVAGGFSQHHKLTLGQNRREMFGFDTERAAIAVVEPVPFDMELVQPKTPILQRGSKELVLKVTRHDGFKGSVYPRQLYAPPGITINNGTDLKPDQTEIRIPMTANGGAAVGAWPMMLQIVYGTSRGSATVSTAAIDLQIEQPVFNFSFPKVAGELGAKTSLTIGLEKVRDIAGEMSVTLVGLPNGVTCPAPTQPVTLDSTAVTFPLEVAADAKPGSHKTLNVQTSIVRDGETMIQTDGTGEMRIDKPLPPKPNASEKKKESQSASPKTPDATKTPAPAKPLSRLEQLRLEKESS